MKPTNTGSFRFVSPQRNAVRTYAVVIVLCVIAAIVLGMQRSGAREDLITYAQKASTDRVELLDAMLSARLRMLASSGDQSSSGAVADVFRFDEACVLTSPLGGSDWTDLATRLCYDHKESDGVAELQWHPLASADVGDRVILWRHDHLDSGFSVLIMEPDWLLEQFSTVPGSDSLVGVFAVAAPQPLALSLGMPDSLLSAAWRSADLRGPISVQEGDMLYVTSGVAPDGLSVVMGHDLEPALDQWRHHSLLLWTTLAILFVVFFAMAHKCVRIYDRRVMLEYLATTDALTGAFNRRYLMDVGRHEVRRAQRYGTSLSLLLIDADFFKEINDEFGHAMGDRVLQLLSRSIMTSLRESDVVARIGGEEFAVLLLHTNLSDAEMLAERLIKTVQNLGIEADNGKIVRLTVSIGVANLTPDESLDQLLSRADRSLYDAKRGGRNQVVMAEDR